MGVVSAAKVLADATTNVHTYSRRRRAVSTSSGGVGTASRLFSTAKESVSTARASMPVSTAGMIQEVNKDKGKGKGIMREFEPEQTKQSCSKDKKELVMKQLDAEVELDHEGFKKQKTNEASGSVQEQPEEEETELPQEDLQQMIMVVLVKEVYVEALQIFAEMLKKFDRDNLVKLWDLVKERFSTTEPTDDKEKELWVELKRLFKPDSDDTLWKL
ncbi:hypothetical protein Tco_1138031 [Tanacetum coccineum]